MELLKRHVKRYCAITSFILLLTQLSLILGSWIFSVIFPGMHLRPLLSGEGLRWFFDSISTNLSSMGLVNILLVGMLGGSIQHNRMIEIFSQRRSMNYREKFACSLLSILLVLYFIVLCLLTLIPHAPLLSVTGDLFPSSFTRGFIPLTLIYLSFVSVVYGAASGYLKTAVEILDNLTLGIVHILPFIFVYFFATELYCSIKFVLAF